MSKTVVVVTGATGMIGSEVCSQLAESSEVELRATLRTPAKEGLLPPTAIPVPFDFEKTESIDAALEGADALFLCTPGGPMGPAYTRAVTDRVANHSLRRIVKQSSFTPEAEPQAPTDLWALETEAMVRDTGVPCTFLQEPWFNQNFTQGYFVPMVAGGMLALPFGTGRSGWIDCRDIAAVAVKALTEDGHQGRTYTLTGPETISLGEIAEILSEVAGKTIRYQPLSDQEWIDASLAMGQPEIVARATLALISKTRDGHATLLSDDVERVTGRKPRKFEEFARDHSQVLSAIASSGSGAGP